MPTGTPQMKHVWSTVIKDEFGTTTLAGSAITILGSNKFAENVLVPTGSQVEIDCGSIDTAKVTSFWMLTTDVARVDTNSSNGAGGQTISLTAGQAYGWNSSQTGINPLTTDITKIYVTNATAKDITFRCDILSNLLI